MIQIIPAIDLIEGNCVRLSQGDFSRSTLYDIDPLKMALQLEDNGFKRLHIVDLDAAKNSKSENLKILESIAQKTSLVIDFGGGINTKRRATDSLNAGAKMISIGSMAIKDKAFVLELAALLGPEKVLIGADVYQNNIVIDAWQTHTTHHIINFIEAYQEAGLNHFFCTDITKDGMLEGCSIDLYKMIRAAFPDIELIASGGACALSDILALDELACQGLIIGKALYENSISPNDLKKYLV